MQKVEGSNPFSRFFANPLHVGGLVSALKPETKWNHPRISLLFQALMLISAWNGLDARRLAPIPSCIDPAVTVVGGRTARYPCSMTPERIIVDSDGMRGLPCARNCPRGARPIAAAQLSIGNAARFQHA
jgi:hypothetical protein